MEREQIRQIVMFLQKYGVSAAYSLKVWKKFGSESVNEIKKNPYRLTDEDINIGFKIADRGCHIPRNRQQFGIPCRERNPLRIVKGGSERSCISALRCPGLIYVKPS